MPATLTPRPPHVGDLLFRSSERGDGTYAVARFNCRLVRHDGSSRWMLETTDCAGRYDDDAEASRAADNLNRAEPWYDVSLESL